MLPCVVESTRFAIFCQGNSSRVELTGDNGLAGAVLMLLSMSLSSDMSSLECSCSSGSSLLSWISGPSYKCIKGLALPRKGRSCSSSAAVCYCPLYRVTLMEFSFSTLLSLSVYTSIS